MIAVIFESWPKPRLGKDYIDYGQKLAHLMEGRDGFISIERFESLSQPGKFVALSFWRDEAAVNAFRQNPVHRAIQSKSRSEVFIDYRLRVASVIRDYTRTDRTQAPQDNRMHGI
ncbi:MAG: antibiotic biosynthesis monooxygenase [Pseudomonadota bacterium]